MKKKCPNCQSKNCIYISGGMYRCIKCGTTTPVTKKNGFFKRIVTKICKSN